MTAEAWLTCEVQAAGRKEQGVPARPVVQPSAGPHAGACCMVPGSAKAARMKPKLGGHQSFMGLLTGKPNLGPGGPSDQPGPSYLEMPGG